MRKLENVMMSGVMAAPLPLAVCRSEELLVEIDGHALAAGSYSRVPFSYEYSEQLNLRS